MNASTKKNTEYDSVNVNFRTMSLLQEIIPRAARSKADVLSIAMRPRYIKQLCFSSS